MSLISKHQLAVFFAVIFAGSIALADDVSSGGDSGQRVYEASCKSCHSGGLSGWFSGAPKTGDQEVWVSLIQKGIPALIESSLNGFGEMSPRGGCETCTDDEIVAAVKYMVDQSR